MTLGKINYGDPFFMQITYTNLDNSLDENAGILFSEHAATALKNAINDSKEYESIETIYACIPIGRVDCTGTVVDWADTDIERMARAAVAMGVNK